MKRTISNNDVLTEIISEITSEADELLKEEKNEMVFGQKLAYATALGIIKTCLSGYDLKKYGLDYDIDKKYLL